MARPLRIEFPGAIYHVTSRGNKKEDIFHNQEDRLIWLDILGQVCLRYKWRCYAWCLMNNHYHILIETVDATLSQGMRFLNGVYTQRINHRHERVGHVFQGRYKAILVEKESYLLELVRYIVLNPVRAGWVEKAPDWQWSSYHAMMEHQKAEAWMETGWILKNFGEDRKQATQSYSEFVESGIKQASVWGELKGQIYLGSDSFIRAASKLPAPPDSENIKEVPRAQRTLSAHPIGWYTLKARDKKEAMALAYNSGSYTMKEISRWFGVHYSTVSRAIKLREKKHDCKT